MNLIAFLAYFLYLNFIIYKLKLYFGVRSTKVFDTFWNSLILLNINIIDTIKKIV